ncbi:MAG: DUF4147 domain-containing protein, partial [SAR324 cluster bacterium]|nr:DUF4147 domain-containing protein [SAR324 cluster bacterium]
MTAALRQQAVAIYQAGLARITPEYLLREALSLSGDTLALNFLEGLRSLTLPPQGRIFLLAVGKAAAPMAMEAQRLLGGRIAEGLVVTKEGFSLPGLPFPAHECAHPVPDERGIAAAAEVERMMGRMGKADLLLVLVSGGASALLPAPLEGISLT